MSTCNKIIARATQGSAFTLVKFDGGPYLPLFMLIINCKTTFGTRKPKKIPNEKNNEGCK
jgi:hypothetical protein